MQQNGALIGTMVFGDLAVELQQRCGKLRHLVVWPRCELVVGDVVDVTGTEAGLYREGEEMICRGGRGGYTYMT